ncbi:MAG: cytochrome c-type biogenesis protein CcmH [Acidimicrobiia bacterium]
MPERTRNITFGAAIVAMLILLVGLIVTNPTQADRVASLGSRIKCPVCQGESIANSPAQMARDMMTLVDLRVSEGVSDQVIVDELLASYSGAVLLDPPPSGQTLLLWLAPFAALIVGAVVILWWKTHPQKSQTPDEGAEVGRPKRRTLVGGLILVGAFAAVSIAAGFFLQDPSGATSGVAQVAAEDLDSVSNETMEAVIAANLDNPQINGMRLALAERYYEAGDYRSAFPHYLAVAEDADATEDEAVAALVRLGWMAWDGNGAVDAAIGLFDQALAIDGASPTARYLKGQVLWCGLVDPAAAAELFTSVLADDDLPESSRTRVQADLDAVSAGESCL